MAVAIRITVTVPTTAAIDTIDTIMIDTTGDIATIDIVTTVVITTIARIMAIARTTVRLIKTTGTIIPTTAAPIVAITMVAAISTITGPITDHGRVYISA